MNTQLVDGLAQIIQSLSKEEKALLDEKLKKVEWYAVREQITKLGEEINAYRGGKPFDPPVEEVIRQMREERDQQILSVCFPNLFPDESTGVG